MPSIRPVKRKSGTSYEVRIHRANLPPQSKTFRTLAEAKKWGNATETKNLICRGTLFLDPVAKLFRHDSMRPTSNLPSHIRARHSPRTRRTSAMPGRLLHHAPRRATGSGVLAQTWPARLKA